MMRCHLNETAFPRRRLFDENALVTPLIKTASQFFRSDLTQNILSDETDVSMCHTFNTVSVLNFTIPNDFFSTFKNLPLTGAPQVKYEEQKTITFYC
jgi:hypothetical protein